MTASVFFLIFAVILWMLVADWLPDKKAKQPGNQQLDGDESKHPDTASSHTAPAQSEN